MSTSIHELTPSPSSDDHTNTIKTTYERAETDLQIHIAAVHNKWDDVCELYEGRPELKTKPVNECLDTPLMIAVRNGSHEFVKQLLNNVETHDRDKWCGVDTSGNNALHYVARVGNIIDAKLMLQCFPETMTTIKNIHGNTPATLAAKLGRKDMIDEVFSEYADTIEMIQVTYEYAETDLQIYKAALRNKWGDVSELFDTTPGLKFKPVNERLETPLMIAVGTNSSHEFVKQLLNNVHHQFFGHDDEWCGMNIHGNNALHYAAKVGNIIDAELMLLCLPGMMQIVKNIDGDTPYLLAAKLGRKDMIDIIRCSGEEIDIIASAIQAGLVGAFEFHFTQLLKYSASELY